MKKWALILCTTLLWASCDRILSSRPAGILSEKQMTDLLVDMHLTEATLSIANDSAVRMNDTTQLRIRFAQVFLKHDTDPDDFNASLTYYLEHIDELDKIYVEVINSLTEIEAKLQPKPVKEIDRMRPGQKMKHINNIWFRTMNKTGEPEEIQYFDPIKYPVEQKIYIPEIADKKPQ